MRAAPLLAGLLLLTSRALAAEAFVTNQGSDSVSVVDLDALAVVATIPVPGKPAGVAVTRDGTRAYVTSPDSKELSVIDTGQRTVLRRFALGGGPLGVAVHPTGAPVYVADWYAHRVLVVDPDRGVTGEVATGESPSGLDLTPDGRLLVTADRDSHQLSLIDTSTLTTVGTVQVGQRPFGVTVDSEGRLAYAANVGSDSISVVDLAQRKVIAEVKVGERPYAVALANGRAFVTDQYASTISVFETTPPFTKLATVDCGEYPEGIAPSPDGRSVYLSAWFDNKLQVMDAESLEITGEVEVGDGPRAFGAFVRR